MNDRSNRSTSSILIIFVIIVICLISDELNAGVICPPGELSVMNSVIIHGTISTRDPIELQRCLETNKNSESNPSVSLNSPGGDVYAAMELGRLFRKYRTSAIVSKPSFCNSSCVFVLAGTVHRATFGKIGIHRPYSIETGTVIYKDAEKSYKKVSQDIKSYLQEMNIPPSLYEAIERVPPEQVRYLTENEIKEFGLYGMDPVEQEVRDASQAARFGISRQEYYIRKSEADLCPLKETDIESLIEWQECQQTTLWGLSRSVYKRRFEHRISICKDLLDNYGVFSQEYNNCSIDVMTGRL